MIGRLAELVVCEERLAPPRWAAIGCSVAALILTMLGGGSGGTRRPCPAEPSIYPDNARPNGSNRLPRDDFQKWLPSPMR